MVHKWDGESVEYILGEGDVRGSIYGKVQILKHCKKNIWNCKWNLNENLSEHD